MFEMTHEMDDGTRCWIVKSLKIGTLVEVETESGRVFVVRRDSLTEVEQA
jgi:hypothetical protein